MVAVRIEDLDASDERLLDGLARLSFETARLLFPNWLTTRQRAREEVSDALADGHTTRVALADGNEPLGWISCARAYGRVWEIHPLLVAVAHQGEGIGARLVRDIEARAISQGAGVLLVSTSDETNKTSVGGRTLYPDPLSALRSLHADRGHPVGFWRRMGYVVSGVIPDAEGPGMPSILLVKQPGG